MSQLNGFTQFLGCRAEKGRGGGLLVHQSAHLSSGKMHFRGCTSGQVGSATAGMMGVSSSVSQIGRLGVSSSVSQIGRLGGFKFGVAHYHIPVLSPM